MISRSISSVGGRYVLWTATELLSFIYARDWQKHKTNVHQKNRIESRAQLKMLGDGIPTPPPRERCRRACVSFVCLLNDGNRCSWRRTRVVFVAGQLRRRSRAFSAVVSFSPDIGLDKCLGWISRAHLQTGPRWCAARVSTANKQKQTDSNEVTEIGYCAG